MNLTAAIKLDYPFSASEKNEVWIDVLNEAAYGRKLCVERLFYCHSVPFFFMGGLSRGRKAAGASPVRQPVSVPPTRLTSGSGSYNELEAHTMTTKPTRASARSKSNVVFIDPRRQKEINLKRLKLAFLERIKSISAAEAEVFNMIFDMNHGKTVCDVVKFSRQERSK